MSEPIDLLSATQDAVVAGLQPLLATIGVDVRHSVKEGTQPPFVLVADIDEENAGGKGEQFSRFTVDVHTIYRGGDRGELLRMMHRVHLLEGVTIEAPGVVFSDGPTFITASASTAGPDGVTFAGLTQFEIYAEPA